jgi:hypothetical protein
MLYREVFRMDDRSLPNGPANGVLMWLQPLADSEKTAPPDKIGLDSAAEDNAGNLIPQSEGEGR